MPTQNAQARLRPCRKDRLERAGRLLDALSDGNPRTALDLAERLFGAAASGWNVQPILRVLERAGAIVRDRRIWSDGYKHRLWLWRIPAPGQEPKPEPEPEPEPKPEPPPKLEKGITPEDLEAHLRQRREIAERKAAKRARGG